MAGHSWPASLKPGFGILVRPEIGYKEAQHGP